MALSLTTAALAWAPSEEEMISLCLILPDVSLLPDLADCLLNPRKPLPRGSFTLPHELPRPLTCFEPVTCRDLSFSQKRW